MADIKVNVGDKVVVYRNMPKLDHYPQEVRKGFEGVVAVVGGCEEYSYGKWAQVWKGTEYQYVKLTYLKRVCTPTVKVSADKVNRDVRCTVCGKLHTVKND